MTKINKIGKSSFVIAILSFLLVAVLAFGGTYAYFTAKTNTVAGKVQTGHLNIGKVAATNSGVTATDTLAMDGGIVVPNEVIADSIFNATVTSNINFYSRVKFSVKITLSTETATHKHFTDGWDHDGDEGTAAKTAANCNDYLENALDALEISLNGDAIAADDASAEATAFNNLADSKQSDGATAKYAGGKVWVIDDSYTATATETTAYYYNLLPYVVTPGADNATKSTTVYFPVKIQVEEFLGSAIKDDAQRCPYWMDATIEVSISFEVIQADYLDTLGVANADTGFGTVADAKEAWNKALGAETDYTPD